MQIKVSADKVAQRTDDDMLVADNSYTVQFTFDDLVTWNQQYKTARFANGGSYTDVIFEGNSCTSPVLAAGVTYVGVIAGSVHTTTSAVLNVAPSIRTHGGTESDPTPSVYDQMMDALNDIYEGAESIASDMVAAAESAENAAASATDAERIKDEIITDEETRASNEIARIAAEESRVRAEIARADAETVRAAIYNGNVSNALNKTVTGSTISIDDASPLPHNLGVTYKGKSVQFGTPTPEAPIPITNAGTLITEGEHSGQWKHEISVSDGIATPTVYEFYTDFPLRSGDYVNVGTGQGIRTRDIKVFDGTEPTTELAFSLSEGVAKLNWTPYINIGVKNILHICTHYASSSSVGIDKIQYSTTAPRMWICVSPETYSTRTYYMAYLASQYAAGAPVTVEYMLATPVAFEITGLTISAFPNTMTITAESEINVTYQRDINKAFEELTAAIVALGGTI